MNEGHLMSELAMPTLPAEQESASIADAKAPTAGQMLRAARETSGLHIAALAVSMKVPVKKLEALEADRLDLLPDAVFVRALASSVCRTLKIDSADILERLPQNAVPRLDAESRSINAPFHSPGYAPGWTLTSSLKNPALLVVLVLLLGAVLLVFLPEASQTADKQPEVPAFGVAPDAMVTPVVNAPMHPSSAAPREVLSVPPQASASGPSKAVEETQVLTDPARPASSTGVVSFKQKGPSWVEVTDSKGVVQVRRILAAGEALTVAGELPLAVVVGRVDVTEVEVRGKPFSLADITKDNVARFEVK